MLDIGMVLSDRYEILERIGAGGMSIVYKAKCRKLQRNVAIKVLREEFAKDESFVNKFRVEALSAASLSHPNIVGIYDVGNDNGEHYIVMEYVEGKTLKDLIEANGAFDTQKVIEYGTEIVSAVKHAHSKKIIHRDIKPQNILVNHEGIIKVTDFGIARAVDSSTIVSTGTAIGSVHYFSPEQAKGKYVGETSDLYSCGIVLFELATGRLPFEADSHVSVALKHINEDLPLPSVINKNVSKSLEAVILKATQKRPEIRYQNADEMLHDLKMLKVNPSYKINSQNIDMSQATILMTPEETNLIRKNASEDKGLSIPTWGNPGPSAIPHKELGLRNEVEPGDDEEEGDDEQEVSKMYTVMVSVAGVLAAVVLIGIVTAFALPWFAKLNQPKVAVVPYVIGKDVDLATKELKDLKLEISVVGEEYKDDVPEGQIIVQAPSKDELAPIGSTVEVIVSKAREMTRVPDVLGLDFVDAQIKIEDQDLTVIVKREFDEKVEQGKVISQDPMAGDSLAVGSKVEIVVSKGSEVIKTIVPKLEGKEEQAAIQTIRNAKLSLGEVAYEEHDTIEKGKVISQSIGSGKEVEENTSVSIVVSKGKKEEPKEEEKPKEEPKSSIKSLTIRIPDFLEEKEAYYVLIRLINENGESKTIYDGEVKKDQFPIPVSVKGTGKGVVETYIDSDRVYADPIEFDEVTQ